MQNEGRTVSKQELFEKVWEDKFTGDGTLNVHIRRLREAIEEEPGKSRVHSDRLGRRIPVCGEKEMKTRTFIGSLIALFLIGLAVFLLFALPEEERRQDTVAVNDVLRTVREDWDSPCGAQEPHLA